MMDDFDFFGQKKIVKFLCFIKSKYLSSRFKGLWENAFLIEWFPLFIGWETLCDIVWWLPFAATIGEEDDVRIPFDRLLLDMVEKGLEISWDRSSFIIN
jgi:hypothetical protein